MKQKNNGNFHFNFAFALIGQAFMFIGYLIPAAFGAISKGLWLITKALTYSFANRALFFITLYFIVFTILKNCK